MKAYSNDLRAKIIEAVESNEYSQAEVAENFRVSKSFVEKLLIRWRNTGSSKALPHGGGKKRVLKEHQEIIRQAVEKQADISLAELSECVEKATGASSDKSMMSRELKILKLERKKRYSTTVSKIVRE